MSICLRDDTAGHKWSRKFFEYTEDDTTQVIKELIGGDVLLDHIQIKAELFGDVKSGASLFCAEHEMMEFTHLLRRISKEIFLKSRMDQESCLTFSESPNPTQGWSFLTSSKWKKVDRKPTWMNKWPVAKLRCGKGSTQVVEEDPMGLCRYYPNMQGLG